MTIHTCDVLDNAAIEEMLFLDATVLINDSIVAADNSHSGVTTTLFDTAQAIDEIVSADSYYLISDTIQATELFSFSEASDVDDFVIAIDRASILAIDDVLDSVSAYAESVLPDIQTDIFDTVEVLEITSFVFDASAISDILTVKDAVSIVFEEVVQDTISALDVSFYDVKITHTVTDTAEIVDDWTPSITFDIGTVHDVIMLSDALLTNVEALDIIEDRAQVSDQFIFADPTAVAYLTNTENLGVTTYDNFPYTSMAQVGSTIFVCSDDGLFTLEENNSDDGDPVNAYVETGLLNFDTSTLKYIPSMYIMNVNVSGVKLDVETYESGHLKHTYTAQIRPNDAPSNTRFKIGKGLCGTHWRFRLSNIDGGTFSIFGGEFSIAVSKRRM